jgi:hypothetical protein
MAMKLLVTLGLLTALAACAPTPPPSCHGPVVSLNAGQWQPVAADLQVTKP